VRGAGGDVPCVDRAPPPLPASRRSLSWIFSLSENREASPAGDIYVRRARAAVAVGPGRGAQRQRGGWVPRLGKSAARVAVSRGRDGVWSEGGVWCGWGPQAGGWPSDAETYGCDRLGLVGGESRVRFMTELADLGPVSNAHTSTKEEDRKGKLASHQMPSFSPFKGGTFGRLW
jgi:hypothetical protein